MRRNNQEWLKVKADKDAEIELTRKKLIKQYEELILIQKELDEWNHASLRAWLE